MSQRYGMEKMHMAVFNLVGPGSMRSRLQNAVNSHLLHLSTEGDIPPSLKSDYNKIIHGLYSHGDIKKELEDISEIDAEKYAQQIVCLFEKTAHLVH